MDEAVTLAEIRRVAIEARPDRPSLLNCNPLNPTIRSALEDELGLTVQEVVGHMVDGPASDEHMWLTIAAEQVVDATQPVIVDGAADQFCDERYHAGEVWVTLGPKQTIGTNRVLVLPADNPEWVDSYQTHHPFA
jgi:hypothetical protein